ncbi:MAG: energy-coupling factor transporter transmembrane protein EcfT [Calothrix sp. C42_A2020_038]|nr:energy-coupling factor transporter transmembrane protein EcfT [Calothrix sp. C42_A2020_038]
MDLLRSLPLGLYLEQPQTWLHKIDPRVKFFWLMSFLTTYTFANNMWRLLLVVLLILTTIISGIPRRIWQQPQQMVGLLFLAFFVFIIGCITPDGLGITYQPRLSPYQTTLLTPQSTPTPTPTNVSAPEIAPTPQPTGKTYTYILFERGPIKVTRRSFDLALRISTILFTVIYSSNLYLITSAPEEITAALEDLMLPLRKLKLPITEVTLTLTLSLRFIPLVLEEIQNLIRAIMTRAINWKKIGFKGAVKIWLVVTERLMTNLFLRAEQMASAITVRGFTSPNQHRVIWHDFKLKRRDWIAIIVLILFWGARLIYGNEVS